MEIDLSLNKVLNHNPKNEKVNGRDYVIVYDFTCEVCRHTWRLTMRPNQISCPKCRSIKVYYMSKRSCDAFVDNDEVVEIPKDSELL